MTNISANATRIVCVCLWKTLKTSQLSAIYSNTVWNRPKMVALARPQTEWSTESIKSKHTRPLFKETRHTGHQTNIYINIMQITADVNISERLSALNVLTRKQFVAAKRLQLAKWRAISPLQIRGARPSPKRSWKPDNFRRSHDFSAINTNMKVWSQTIVSLALVWKMYWVTIVYSPRFDA